MKPITLHPLSVLAGLALAGALVVIAGATQQPIVARQVPPETRVVGVIPAEWWTCVRLVDAAPNFIHTTYAVPSDRYFVVTLRKDASVLLQDGQSVETLLSGVPDRAGSGGPEYNGTRIVFPPGAVLETPVGSGLSATLWGYLEPVR
jgi:hypothetical protein